MQTNILQKCVDELGKENPKLDYVRGMLETLISFNGESSNGRTPGFGPVNGGPIPSSPTKKDPEAAVLEAGVSAALAKMPPLETQ